MEFSAGFYNHHSLNHSGKLSPIHLINNGAAKGKYLLRRKPPFKYGAAKGKYLLKRSTKLKDGEPEKSHSTTDQRDHEENQRMSGLCHRPSN